MFMEEEIQEKLNDKSKTGERQRIEKILSKRIKMRSYIWYSVFYFKEHLLFIIIFSEGLGIPQHTTPGLEHGWRESTGNALLNDHAWGSCVSLNSLVT